MTIDGAGTLGRIKALRHKQKQDRLRMAKRQVVVRRIYLQYTNKGIPAGDKLYKMIWEAMELIEYGPKVSWYTIRRDVKVIRAQLDAQGRCPHCGRPLGY